MARIPAGRVRALALQGIATAVTALLIGGAAMALGQPLGPATEGATEQPTAGVSETPTDGVTDGVTEGPTETVTDGPTEPVTDDPTDDPTEDITGPTPDTTSAHDDAGHGKAVSDAARGLTPPVGNCRNHGHWVSTVAKGLASCDDNPRPAHGDVDEPAKPAKQAKPAKAHAKPAEAHAKPPKAKPAKARKNR